MSADEWERDHLSSDGTYDAEMWGAQEPDECEVCGRIDLCDDCAEDERERDRERAERLAEEDRFLYTVPIRSQPSGEKKPQRSKP